MSPEGEGRGRRVPATSLGRRVTAGDLPVIEDLPAGAPTHRVLPGAGDAGAAPPVKPAPMRPAVARTGRPRYGEGAQIACDNLVKIYKVADLEVVALQGLDLLVQPGEMVAIVGASGSGKSTLMNILGGLETPSAGRVHVAGHDLTQMDRSERVVYRRRVVGVIWQQTARNLLPYLSAAENVELPMLLDGRQGARERALGLLAMMGLGGRADERPDRMSGGEQQRIAIAVALANEPAVVLADEPTGELDSVTSDEVFGLLRQVNAELGTTILVVTHDPHVAGQVQRTVAIRDGRTSSETLRRTQMTDAGEHEVIAEEFAVLDRAGRLQLPRAHVEALGLAHRVRVRLEGDHVTIRPDTHVAPRSTAQQDAGRREVAGSDAEGRDAGLADPGRPDGEGRRL